MTFHDKSTEEVLISLNSDRQNGLDDNAASAALQKYGENKLKEYAKIDNSNLNSDGYVLKKIRQTVFIVGECDRATLYGAYDWLERTLGVKFLSGSYEYIPIDQCYVWQATKNLHYFGPTKVEVSLVWLIGRGNYNKK